MKVKQKKKKYWILSFMINAKHVNQEEWHENKCRKWIMHAYSEII
jgi:hypothetical protein